MSTELAITPRNLGSIRVPGYCPRCFKFQLLLKFHPPYNHFGAAIFSDAQRSQEAVLGYYLENQRSLPKEFAPFCDCVARVEYNGHWSQFRTTHKSGVLLYGSPDEILERKDGSLCVIDHKTAHPKAAGKDPFHGQYETQVVGYAYIAEGMGLGKVTLGGLLYWSAQVEAVQTNPSDHYTQSTLWMPFKPATVEIKIDYTTLDPLIEELKAVWNAKELPDGREGCDDCKKRELLFAIDEKYKRQDQATLEDYADVACIRQRVKQRMWGQTAYRRELLAEFGTAGGAVFSRDGVIPNWEYLPFEDSADAAIAPQERRRR